MSKDNSTQDFKGFERYGRKWYVRHDCNPEMIPDSWDKLHFDYMKKLGNVFENRLQAMIAGQKIRFCFISLKLQEVFHENPDIEEKITDIISGVDNS